jgi:hypothetical protein
MRNLSDTKPFCGTLNGAREQQDRCGFGIVLSKQMGGSNPVHPCITVLYPKIGKAYDVAESLMEVVSESR